MSLINLPRKAYVLTKRPCPMRSAFNGRRLNLCGTQSPIPRRETHTSSWSRNFGFRDAVRQSGAMTLRTKTISYVAMTVLVITWMTVIDLMTILVGVGRIVVVVVLAAPVNVVTGDGVLLHIVSVADYTS